MRLWVLGFLSFFGVPSKTDLKQGVLHLRKTFPLFAVHWSLGALLLLPCESHGPGFGYICGSIHNVSYNKIKMAATVLREASWRRRWKPDLRSQPWKPFNVSDKEYLIKSMFVETDCSYELCIWDFTHLWYEKVEQDSFHARAKVFSFLYYVRKGAIFFVFSIFHWLVCLANEYFHISW